MGQVRQLDPFRPTGQRGACPLVQYPELSQSYNRYTYMWNNPTSMTNPTGFDAAQTNQLAILCQCVVETVLVPVVVPEEH